MITTPWLRSTGEGTGGDGSGSHRLADTRARPQNEGPSIHPGPSDHLQRGEGKCSILVVDDRSSLRRLMEFALASDTVRITTAANGVEADRLLIERSFDLVLLDLRMPEMGGLELLARLRERGDLVRIIVESADLVPETLVTAVAYGVVGFLRKPFSIRQLRDCVGIHLNDFEELPGAAGYRAAARMEFEVAADILQAESGDGARGSRLATCWQPLFRSLALGEPSAIQFGHARRILRSDFLLMSAAES